MKPCAKCKVKKPLSDYTVDRARPDGRCTRCRACVKAGFRARSREERDKLNAARRARYENDGEKIRARKRERYDPIKQRERDSGRYAKASAEAKARILQRKREGHERNRAKVSAQKRAYYLRKRAEDLEAWRLKSREAANRRNASIRGVTTEPVDYDRILARDGMRCHICREPIRQRKELQFDHVIPVAKGGAHAEANIAPAHAKCNQRKNDRVLTLF